ncbi:MAG: HAMP domain-containing sensor histidine kinase [Desulfofustis sp.]|jgi:signal transduction histidine kinase|nr:HAMP domain-containing sensor histidine kinase [Desulfofustis sp.]
MKLFLAIYSWLLISIVILLAIDGNISYETAIRQFDADMADQAEQIGLIVAGMITETWQKNGEHRAMRLIENANAANKRIRFRWFFLDDLPAERRTIIAAQAEATADSGKGIVSLIETTQQKERYRVTYVPTDVPSGRRGVLELTQSLAPLADYTRKMLIRSLVITALLATISGIILYVFIHVKIRGPLERLSAKAVRIGKGDIDPDLPVKGSDELADLARTMNDMCTRLLIAKGKIHFEHEARIKTLEQLRHSEKLSTIGRIAAGIAHELGTPLNVVDGRAAMIVKEDLDRRETREYARIIRQQAEKMSTIIRQLLDFSRRGTTQKAPQSAEVILRQVVGLLQPLADRQHATLILVVQPGTDSLVCVDGGQVQQIVTNLVVNALQAMIEPGKITIAVANEEICSMERTDGRRKRVLKITVADDGPGIAEQHREHLFEPFFTTKQTGSGTGLGLSIARELAEEQGGWLEACIRPERGACFLFILPCCAEPSA